MAISNKQVIDFLQSNLIMALATTGEDGTPHVAPMLYLFREPRSFYFVSRDNTQKYRNIVATKKVSLAIWKLGELGVYVDGTTEVVSDELERNGLIDALIARAATQGDFWPPVLQFGSGDYAIIRITPHLIRCIDLSLTYIQDKKGPMQIIEL